MNYHSLDEDRTSHFSIAAALPTIIMVVAFLWAIARVAHAYVPSALVWGH